MDKFPSHGPDRSTIKPLAELFEGTAGAPPQFYSLTDRRMCEINQSMQRFTPLLHQVVHHLALMRTAVGLLALSAIASMAGTVVPQGLPLEDYVAQWGVTGAQVLWYSGLTDVFRAWWFLGIQAVMLVSVSVCIWRNGPRIGRQMFMPKALPAFVKPDTRTSEELENEGFQIRGNLEGYQVWSRGELNRAGYFLVHIGVLAVAVAGLLTGLLGWRGNLNIRENETDNTVLVWQGRTPTRHALPFSLTNREFIIEYYNGGMPKRFATRLEVNGQTHEIEVNKPFSIGGYTFYQASFGDGGSAVSGLGLDVQTGTVTPFNAKVYDTARMADGTRIELLDFRPETVATEKGRRPENIGGSLDYLVQPPDRAALQLRAYAGQPDFIGVADGQKLSGTDEGAVVYRPVYLGLSLADTTAWQVVARAVSTCPPVAASVVDACFADKTAVHLKTIADAATRMEHAVQLLQAYKTTRALGLTHLVRLDNYTTRRYSGLLVVKDPGAWLFWPGALVLMLGVVLMLGRRFAQVFKKI